MKQGAQYTDALYEQGDRTVFMNINTLDSIRK
jgi:hypothetical protein